MSTLHSHAIASREEWLEARRALLTKEKALTRARDQLAAERRALPWVKVEKQSFWSPRFGMVADRFGVSWMINVSPGESARSS